ncbi:unnamed protein product, partial [Closterium sp. Naga37s-1]
GLSDNRLTGAIPTVIGNLFYLQYLSLSENRLSGTIPATISNLPVLSYLGLCRNYLTGPLVNLLPFSQADLTDNFLSGVVSAPDCRRLNIAANCFSPNKACRPAMQRLAAQCMAFCGIYPTASACGGHGVCYPDGPSLVPTCLCDAGSLQLGGITCISGGDKNCYAFQMAKHRLC